MSNSQIDPNGDSPSEGFELVRAGHKQLEDEMHALFMNNGELVTVWITNQLSFGKLSLEEASIELARGFLRARNYQELKSCSEALNSVEHPDPEFPAT